MASNELTVADVKRALDVAREAMERDEKELRDRGRATASPDFSSVGLLAAGILVANAISRERSAEDENEATPRVPRARTPRVTART